MTETTEQVSVLAGLPGRLTVAVGDRTLSKLISASGLTQPTWNGAMAGRNVPSLKSLEAMANALGVDLAWLITGKGDAQTEDPDVLQVNTRLLSPKTKQLLAIFHKAAVALSASLKADADNY